MPLVVLSFTDWKSPTLYVFKVVLRLSEREFPIVTATYLLDKTLFLPKVDGLRRFGGSIMLFDDVDKILRGELVGQFDEEIVKARCDFRIRALVHHLIVLEPPEFEHVVEVAVHEPKDEVADDLLLTLAHLRIKRIAKQGKSESSHGTSASE